MQWAAFHMCLFSTRHAHCAWGSLPHGSSLEHAVVSYSSRLAPFHPNGSVFLPLPLLQRHPSRSAAHNRKRTDTWHPRTRQGGERGGRGREREGDVGAAKRLLRLKHTMATNQRGVTVTQIYKQQWAMQCPKERENVFAHIYPTYTANLRTPTKRGHARDTIHTPTNPPKKTTNPLLLPKLLPISQYMRRNLLCNTLRTSWQIGVSSTRLLGGRAKGEERGIPQVSRAFEHDIT